jgi:hypothetical protein
VPKTTVRCCGGMGSAEPASRFGCSGRQVEDDGPIRGRALFVPADARDGL